MNKLERYRTEASISYATLAKRVGYDRSAVWKHCNSKLIPAEAAIRYSQLLTIPLEDLRPDLFKLHSPTPGSPTHTHAEATPHDLSARDSTSGVGA